MVSLKNKVNIFEMYNRMKTWMIWFDFPILNCKYEESNSSNSDSMATNFLNFYMYIIFLLPKKLLERNNDITFLIDTKAPTTSRWLEKIRPMDLVKKRIPVLQWGPRYKMSYFLKDCLAGFTVALTEIPQGIAYAKIAGEKCHFISFWANILDH